MAGTRRRGWWALGFSLVAVGWTLALAVGVFVAPSYNDGSTLAEVNGAWVTVPVAVPAVLAGLAFLGLHRRCTHGSGRGTVWAWCAIVLLFAFAVVSMFSVGPFVLIPALLLAVSASLTPRAAQRT